MSLQILREPSVVIPRWNELTPGQKAPLWERWHALQPRELSEPELYEFWSLTAFILGESWK